MCFQLNNRISNLIMFSKLSRQLGVVVWNLIFANSWKSWKVIYFCIFTMATIWLDDNLFSRHFFSWPRRDNRCYRRYRSRDSCHKVDRNLFPKFSFWEKPEQAGQIFAFRFIFFQSFLIYYNRTAISNLGTRSRTSE